MLVPYLSITKDSLNLMILQTDVPEEIYSCYSPNSYYP